MLDWIHRSHCKPGMPIPGAIGCKISSNPVFLDWLHMRSGASCTRLDDICARLNLSFSVHMHSFRALFALSRIAFFPENVFLRLGFTRVLRLRCVRTASLKSARQFRSVVPGLALNNSRSFPFPPLSPCMRISRRHTRFFPCNMHAHVRFPRIFVHMPAYLRPRPPPPGDAGPAVRKRKGSSAHLGEVWLSNRFRAYIISVSVTILFWVDVKFRFQYTISMYASVHAPCTFFNFHFKQRNPCYKKIEKNCKLQNIFFLKIKIFYLRRSPKPFFRFPGAIGYCFLERLARRKFSSKWCSWSDWLLKSAFPILDIIPIFPFYSKFPVPDPIGYDPIAVIYGNHVGRNYSIIPWKCREND